jgi:hypothetical protein
MTPDVISASHLEDYKIELTFDDGSKGVVDFSKYLSLGWVFKRFHDKDFFLSFEINGEIGVLSWRDERDDIEIAPETLHSEARGPHFAIGSRWKKVRARSQPGSLNPRLGGLPGGTGSARAVDFSREHGYAPLCKKIGCRSKSFAEIDRE